MKTDIPRPFGLEAIMARTAHGLDFDAFTAALAAHGGLRHYGIRRISLYRRTLPNGLVGDRICLEADPELWNKIENYIWSGYHIRLVMLYVEILRALSEIDYTNPPTPNELVAAAQEFINQFGDNLALVDFLDFALCCEAGEEGALPEYMRVPHIPVPGSDEAGGRTGKEFDDWFGTDFVATPEGAYLSDLVRDHTWVGETGSWYSLVVVPFEADRDITEEAAGLGVCLTSYGYAFINRTSDSDAPAADLTYMVHGQPERELMLD